MSNSLPDILYLDDKFTPIIDSSGSLYQIPFYKGEQFFSNLESYIKFINSVKDIVYKHPRYKKYKEFLMKTMGLNYCQVFPEITSDDADIDMHHGPILGLFDIIEIILEYFSIKEWKITTLRVADHVLYEHEQGLIQTVMLSESGHQQVTDRSVFLNYKQGYPSLKPFIKKYLISMNAAQQKKINDYIDRSLLYDSNDFGLFELNDLLFKHI